MGSERDRETGELGAMRSERSVCAPAPARLSRQRRHSFDIPCHGDQLPLPAHRGQATQQERPEAHHRFDDAEYRFQGLLAQGLCQIAVSRNEFHPFAKVTCPPSYQFIYPQITRHCLELLHHLVPIMACPHQVPPTPEMIRHLPMRGQKSLRMFHRLEPSHTTFPFPSWLMRVLRPIIESPATAVLDLWNQFTMCARVARQFIGD